MFVYEMKNVVIIEERLGLLSPPNLVSFVIQLVWNYCSVRVGHSLNHTYIFRAVLNASSLHNPKINRVILIKPLGAPFLSVSYVRQTSSLIFR